jgi:hypothetical protein
LIALRTHYQGRCDSDREGRLAILDCVDYEEFHKAFQAGELQMKTLGYYLNFFKDIRQEMIGDIRTNSLTFFNIGTRLGKFPPGWTVLADRGFAYDAFKYPNLNPHITPHFIQKRDQFTQEEMESDQVCCMLRLHQKPALPIRLIRQVFKM